MKRLVLLVTASLLGAVAPAQAHLRAVGAFGGTSKTPVETLSGADAAGAASGLAVVGHNAIGRGRRRLHRALRPSRRA